MEKKPYCSACKGSMLLIDRVRIDRFLKGRCRKCGKPVIIRYQDKVHNNKASTRAYNFSRKV